VWRSFCAEEDAAWFVVERNKPDQCNSFVRHDHSFVDAVKKTPLTEANRVPIPPHQGRRSVFDQLVFQKVFFDLKNKGENPIGQFHKAGPAEFERGRFLNFGAASSQLPSAEI
jgi:hypothetical protein